MTPDSIAHILTGKRPIGSRVVVEGWVKSRRTSKGGFSFIALNDGSSIADLQAVADAKLDNYDDEVIQVNTGCALRVTGTVVESQGTGQAVEIQSERIEVVGWVDDPESYPIAKKRHTFEYLRSVAHLRPRTNTFGAIARLRNTVMHAVHDYLHANGFLWVNTPIITASDCEGAGELFRVSTLDLVNLPRTPTGGVDFTEDFFGEQTYLTVSGQLNIESYCLALSRVYTFGPTFRAENSHTSRHLAEFWMIEPELAFADVNDNADLAEAFLKSVFETVLSERSDDVGFFVERVDSELVSRMENVINSSFERMDYTEAVRILERADRSFEFPVAWGHDLQSEHERYLTEQHVGRPVIVLNYPKDIKAFYMRRNDDERTVAAMDVLVPGVGEIIGGSQREERLEVLDARLKEMGIEEELWWYRDLRRYGTVPHSGFGLGLERLLMYITGMENIRDVIPFPRVPQNASF
jgi:asparaginyl-tRNA synthetase